MTCAFAGVRPRLRSPRPPIVKRRADSPHRGAPATLRGEGLCCSGGFPKRVHALERALTFRGEQLHWKRTTTRHGVREPMNSKVRRLETEGYLVGCTTEQNDVEGPRFRDGIQRQRIDHLVCKCLPATMLVRKGMVPYRQNPVQEQEPVAGPRRQVTVRLGAVVRLASQASKNPA